MAKYGKNYDQIDQVRLRLKLYQEKKVLVETNNLSNKDFQLELNYFADLTDEEMEMRKGHRVTSQALTDEEPKARILSESEIKLKTSLPQYYDWTQLGGVTPVKD